MATHNDLKTSSSSLVSLDSSNFEQSIHAGFIGSFGPRCLNKTYSVVDIIDQDLEDVYLENSSASDNFSALTDSQDDLSVLRCASVSLAQQSGKHYDYSKLASIDLSPANIDCKNLESFLNINQHTNVSLSSVLWADESSAYPGSLMLYATNENLNEQVCDDGLNDTFTQETECPFDPANTQDYEDMDEEYYDDEELDQLVMREQAFLHPIDFEQAKHENRAREPIKPVEVAKTSAQHFKRAESKRLSCKKVYNAVMKPIASRIINKFKRKPSMSKPAGQVKKSKTEFVKTVAENFPPLRLRAPLTNDRQAPRSDPSGRIGTYQLDNNGDHVKQIYNILRHHQQQANAQAQRQPGNPRQANAPAGFGNKVATLKNACTPNLDTTDLFFNTGNICVWNI